jgi:hypothetical protein
MNSTATKRKVVRRTVEEEAARLRAFIGHVEHRYGCSSADMQFAVASGKMRETAEVSRWLAALDFLRDLNAHGVTTGTRTPNTR